MMTLVILPIPVYNTMTGYDTDEEICVWLGSRDVKWQWANIDDVMIHHLYVYEFKKYFDL